MSDQLAASRRKRAGFSDEKPKIDRLPPHSPEAEAGVLGCVMLSPNECLAECVEKWGQNHEVFYDLRHQEIYKVLVKMWDAKKPIDVITLQEELKLAGQLENIGGIAYVMALPDAVPSAANLNYYVEIVDEKNTLREMLRTCYETGMRIYEWEGAVDELVDKVENDILQVSKRRAVVGQRSMKELTLTTINRMEEMHRGVGMLGGLRTHLGYFDKKTGGLHDKELMILAARPSVGKTSLMMTMAANLALKEKKPVGIFSLEMSSEDLNFRLLCQEAEVNFHKIRTGFMAQGDLDSITSIAPKIAKAPIYIDDTPGLSILALKAKARRMVQQHGVKIFFVDYLQLMHSTNPRAKNREQEIADISGGLKALAKELAVPVVALAQLNRDVAKSKNRKPQLEDLRESGAIEQDADIVEILYRPRTAEDDEEADEFQVNGLIAKQRNGPTGDVEYWFKRWCMKYQDAYGNRGKEKLASDEELGISRAAKI